MMYISLAFFLDFCPDEDMLEILKTDFQLRLLWGSRGAGVNQTERHDKFKLILTALSRKLEPPVKQTELWKKEDTDQFKAPRGGTWDTLNAEYTWPDKTAVITSDLVQHIFHKQYCIS